MCNRLNPNPYLPAPKSSVLPTHGVQGCMLVPVHAPPEDSNACWKWPRAEVGDLNVLTKGPRFQKAPPILGFKKCDLARLWNATQLLKGWGRSTRIHTKTSKTFCQVCLFWSCFSNVTLTYVGRRYRMMGDFRFLFLTFPFWLNFHICILLLEFKTI